MPLVKYVLPFIFLIGSLFSFAQQGEQKMFSHADTLRGSNGPGRDWWDVLKYDLDVKFNIGDSSISGSNRISLKVLRPGKVIQIDLQDPLVIDSIFLEFSTPSFTKEKIKSKVTICSTGISKIQNFKKDGNAYFITPDMSFNEDFISIELNIFYHGKPRIATRPPWDGGVVWAKDQNNNPWVSIACQGLGASVWYPCKDYQGDEPESASMSITCPDSLVCVGMGRQGGKKLNGDGTATYFWSVQSPINNYSLIPYIGKYVHFGETYKGLKGKLDMDYWVLDYNLTKAKKQFTDAPKMMKAFEYWFGPYPFYEDGYKLVEAPYLGMEHQSAIAYGNGYRNGYSGSDLSGSGEGLNWDFIIVHESGHEWFGNNITTKDIADMWVHEGFTDYSETLFTEFYWGKAAGERYVQGLRKNIQNDKNIIGYYGVNNEGSGDMYYKGANMIHMIRQLTRDDKTFREMLVGMNKTFYHQTVTTQQIENYISKKLQLPLAGIFDQYLRTTKIPVLEYKITGKKVSYRWTNAVDNLVLPVKVTFGARTGKEKWLTPGKEWKKIIPGAAYDGKTFEVNKNFYIESRNIL